jgi:signal transduction histidine kinase
MPHEGAPPLPPALAAGAEIAFICDERGSVVAASESFGGLLGRRADAMVGQALAHLAVHDDEPAVRSALADARRGGSAIFEVRLRSERGPPLRARIAAWSVACGCNGARVILCLVSSGNDRRRRAEERARVLADTQRTIATVLALALEEIPLDDLLGRTLDLILDIPWLSIARKGAIFLVEEDPRTLVMKVSRGLAPALVAGCARVAFGSCLCGEAALHATTVYTSSLEARHTTRYARIVPHGHYCVPIKSGDSDVLGVLTTYLAAGHERSEIEVEFLSAVANTLAGVLARRRADAERHRAVDASRRKSELLALASHELLTPVTAVMLSCERLGRDREAPLAPRHAEIVSRMEGALGRLAGTIRLLLEHSRLEIACPLVRHDPLDLGALAAGVLDEVRPAAEHKGLAVRLAVESPLPPVRSDDRLLRIVLANLAANAVKFTASGWVAVRVRYGEGAHRVEVEDTGPGIPPAERRRIFERFEPLEPLANKHLPGLGLGLPLARRLADALGATLALEPAEGRGSRFVVTLPEPVPPADGVQLH